MEFGDKSESGMRVLHLLSSSGVYGAEKMVVSLARGLQQLGCESVLGIFENQRKGPSEVATYMREQGLNTVVIPCNGKIDRTAANEIRRCINVYEISLLHSHGYKADLYGYVATRSMRFPVVATSHFWTRRTVALRIYARLDQYVLRQFDHVVAVSDQIAGEILAGGVSSEFVSVIDNGIDLAALQQPSRNCDAESRVRGKRTIGAVGRLVDQKGFDYLLQAIPAVLKQFPETILLIVGEGPKRAKLEALASELKIADSVRFTGACNDMPRVYSSLDLFVLSSVDEGMPLALIEAMAVGKPVVATRVAAVPKLVLEGVTGRLVEPRDPAAISAAICELLRDPASCAKLGEAARARMEARFSSELMAERYLRLYRSVLKRRSPATEGAPCHN